VLNKARVESCIAEAFMCKEITDFSSMYFSRANNVNAHTMRYQIVKEVPLNFFNGRVKVLRLLVHIMLQMMSETIP
jgi:hypothetical protein